MCWCKVSGKETFPGDSPSTLYVIWCRAPYLFKQNLIWLWWNFLGMAGRGLRNKLLNVGFGSGSRRTEVPLQRCVCCVWYVHRLICGLITLLLINTAPPSNFHWDIFLPSFWLAAVTSSFSVNQKKKKKNPRWVCPWVILSFVWLTGESVFLAHWRVYHMYFVVRKF